MPDAAAVPDSSFADRLNYLWETVHPHGKPYTYEQVAAGVADLGYEISTAYLWQLRNGKRTNPTLQHLEGLAKFFGVPTSYFLDAEAERRVNEQLELVASLRDAGIQNIALRARGLSKKGLAALETMVEQLRNMEHLPSTAESDGGGRP